MKRAAGIVAVFMTVPDAAIGAAIGKAAVEGKLAACANLVPGLRSIYSWKGKICDDREVLVIFKTRGSLLKKLEKLVKAMHPYEVPELIALPVLQGLDDYLDWLKEGTLPR